MRSSPLKFLWAVAVGAGILLPTNLTFAGANCRGLLTWAANGMAPQHLDKWQYPRPGQIDAVVVVIERDGRLLFTQRGRTVGEGTWGFPGGKIEPGESIRQAAERELLEELNLPLLDMEYLGVASVHEFQSRKIFRVYVVRSDADGEPVIMEPHKMTRIEWVAPERIPEPVFQPNRAYLGHVLALLKNMRKS